MILVDTSGMFAALDRRQDAHERAAAVLRGAPGPFVLSPFVLAELDYFLGRRVGQDAQLATLAEIGRGAFRVECFSSSDVDAARRVIERYADLRIGLTDASIVVLAGRYNVKDVLTLDHRHFDALRTPTGQRFRILPRSQ